VISFPTPPRGLARIPRLAASALLALTVTSCALSYKPPAVPLVFTLDGNGTFSVNAEASVATPLGTFSASAEVSRPLSDGHTRVSITHQVQGVWVKDVFDLSGRGPLVLCLDGWFSSRIDESHVDIRALDGVSRVGLLGGNASLSDCATVVGTPDSQASAVPSGTPSLGYGQVLGPAPGVAMPLMSNSHWPSSIVGSVLVGQLVQIECTAQGDLVQNPYGGVSTLWNKVGPGYVPDVYTFTGTDQPVAPRCS